VEDGKIASRKGLRSPIHKKDCSFSGGCFHLYFDGGTAMTNPFTAGSTEEGEKDSALSGELPQQNRRKR
jgi:hypothetical protein